MTSNLRFLRRPLMSQLKATYLRTQTSQFMPITLRTNPTMTIDRTFHKTVSRRDDKKMREKLDDEDRILDSILSSSLEEVLTHGWSLTAVEAAVKKLGYPPVTAGLVESPAELVLHHINSSNLALDVWMEEEVARLTAGGQKLPVGKFVRSCVVTRLSMNGPLVRAGLWSEAVALVCQSDPGEALETWQEVCDDIWFRAGDTSHDINWYTKRITLAAVMAATDVFMLQDNSPDFQESWRFLDRRLQDLSLVPTVSKIPEDVMAVADGLFQTFKILAGVKR